MILLEQMLPSTSGPQVNDCICYKCYSSGEQYAVDAALTSLNIYRCSLSFDSATEASQDPLLYHYRAGSISAQSSPLCKYHQQNRVRQLLTLWKEEEEATLRVIHG